MASGASSGRIIQFADAATLDIASIDNSTAAMWGPRQADLYVEFLQDEVLKIATSPEIGRDTEQFPGIKSYVAKLKRRRQSHGHRIVYREIPGGIRVIRILHTAMQWHDHVETE